MTPSESGRPTPPRLPPDLSSESDLRLIAGCEIDHETIQGDFSNGDLEGLHVEDSRIVGSSFTAADLNRLRLIDVVVEGSDFSGADMEDAVFTRVIFTDCRMSGALFPRAQMQDVTFSEVRLDQVNFRMIEGERVAGSDEQRGVWAAHDRNRAETDPSGCPRYAGMGCEPSSARNIGLGGVLVPVWAFLFVVGHDSSLILAVAVVLVLVDVVVLSRGIGQQRRLNLLLSRRFGTKVWFLNSPSLREGQFQAWCQRHGVNPDSGTPVSSGT
jgi:hypothetical protein